MGEFLIVNQVGWIVVRLVVRISKLANIVWCDRACHCDDWTVLEKDNAEYVIEVAGDGDDKNVKSTFLTGQGLLFEGQMSIRWLPGCLPCWRVS